PGTVGLILREELTIVGPKGDPLPDGKVGEIVVHGPTVSPDIGTDAGGEAQHSNDRRLFTGDLGSIDSEGYLTVVGRTKEPHQSWRRKNLTRRRRTCAIAAPFR